MRIMDNYYQREQILRRVSGTFEERNDRMIAKQLLREASDLMCECWDVKEKRNESGKLLQASGVWIG